MRIPIDKFYIKDDYRTQHGDMGAFARRIQKEGLLNLITVETDGNKYKITSGRRRFRALVEYLGYEELEEGKHFRVVDWVDELIVQLEENLDREDPSPYDIALLVKQIHDEKIKEHGQRLPGGKEGWSLKDTATLLARDKAYVSRLISLAENPEIAQSAKSMHEALQNITKKKSKDIQSKVRKARIEKASEEVPKDLDDWLSNFYNQTAESHITTVTDESHDLIYVDPPFGIDYDQIVNTDEYEAYKDDIESLIQTLTFVIPHFYRILKDNRYCIIWTGYTLIDWVKEQMHLTGFTTSDIPIIWSKLNTKGRTLDPDKKLASMGQVAVYGWKGRYAELNEKGRGNVFPYPIIRKNRIHVAQMPDELVSDHFKIFSTPGSLIYDCFGGSGTTIRAGYITKRYTTVCEKSQENYENAINYIRDWAVRRQE